MTKNRITAAHFQAVQRCLVNEFGYTKRKADKATRRIESATGNAFNPDHVAEAIAAGLKGHTILTALELGVVCSILAREIGRHLNPAHLFRAIVRGAINIDDFNSGPDTVLFSESLAYLPEATARAVLARDLCHAAA